MHNSNEKVLLLPQCETREALENIEEIVNIEGFDAVANSIDTIMFKKVYKEMMEAVRS